MSVFSYGRISRGWHPWETVAGVTVGSLQVFRTTIEVMLIDGVLTREEQRLCVSLANNLKLSNEEPAEIYAAIREGKETDSGREIPDTEQRNIYKNIYEVAIVNASLSQDEFRVLAHLREQFGIDDQEHQKIEDELKHIMKERFEDENVLEKMLGTLKDSVSMVGSLFDSVRTKSA